MKVTRYVKQKGEVMPLKEHAGLVAEFVQTSNIQLFIINQLSGPALQSFRMQQPRNIFIATISCLRSNTKVADLLRHFKNQLRMIKMKQARLDPEAVLKKYQTLLGKQFYTHNRYERGTLFPRPRGWHQNERRLFLWFLFAYYHLNYKKYSEITSKEWREFSECFGGKDILLLRYEAVALQRSSERVFWAAAEEALLRDLFKSSANGKWGDFSRGLFFRSEGQYYKTSKQCREHWFNHLNTDIRKGGWTIEEDLAILTFVKNEGRHWSRLIDQIGRVRTEHMAKNRFSSLMTLGRKYCNALSEVNQNDQNILITSLIEYLNTHRALLYDSNSPSSPELVCKSDKSISIECPEIKEELQVSQDKEEMHPTGNRFTQQSILGVTDNTLLPLKDAANQERYYNPDIRSEKSVSLKRQENQREIMHKSVNEQQAYLYNQNDHDQRQEVSEGNRQSQPQQGIIPQVQIMPQTQMVQREAVLLHNENQIVNPLGQAMLYTVPAPYAFSFNTMQVHPPNVQFMQPFLINYTLPFVTARVQEEEQSD